MRDVGTGKVFLAEAGLTALMPLRVPPAQTCWVALSRSLAEDL